MVLELLVNPKKFSGKRWEMFFIGFAFTLISVLLSVWVFKGYVSIVMVSLISIVSVPFLLKMLEIEEEKGIKIFKEIKLLKEHSKALLMMVYLFFGVVAGFLLIYIFMPFNLVQEIFRIQIDTITAVNTTPTGAFIENFSFFSRILLNNLKILFFCLVFSLFFGVGAFFILIWNASVMATAIGTSVRNALASLGSGTASYFHVVSFSILKYLTHGIPEIGGYFVGALAGGILSVSIIRNKFMNKKFKHVLLDVVDLVLIAIVLLLLAGVIEAFINPLIF